MNTYKEVIYKCADDTYRNMIEDCVNKKLNNRNTKV